MNTILDKEPPIYRTMRIIFFAWVFLLVLALFPYTSDPAGPIKYLISAVAALVLSIMGLIAALQRPESTRSAGPLLLLLSLFLGVNLLAAVLSDHPANSLDAVRPWVVFSLLAFHAAQLFTREAHAWPLLAVAAAAAGLSSVYGFSQYFGFDPFPWGIRDIEEYHGLPSTYANPNFAGHTLVMALLMALGAFSVRERWPRPIRWGLILLAVLMGGHLYLTRIRGARIALAALIVMMAVFGFARRRSKTPLRAAILTCAVMGLCTALLAAALFAAAVSMAPHREVPLDGSLTLRLNGYYGAARMVLHHPILGVGPGNYALKNIPYWTAFEKRWFVTESKKNAHAHCDALEAGTDAGLPGIAVYLALLIWAILCGLRMAADPASSPERRRLSLTLAACAAAFAVDGCFGFNLRVPVSAGFFFLLLGALQGLAGGARPALGRRAALLLQSAVLLVALLCGFFGLRAFIGERLYQRGVGAVYWANSFAEMKDAAAEERLLQNAYAIFADGSEYLPWDARFPESLGQLDLRARRFDAAIMRFQQAIACHPSLPSIHVSLAQAHINRALALNASDAGAMEARARFLQHLDAAEAAAQRAIALCDTLPEAYEAAGRVWLLRAVHHQNAGQDAAPEWEKAGALLTDALRQGTPNRASVQRMLAQYHEQGGRIEEAEICLKRAAESDPANGETWRYFRVFAQQHARPDACIDALSKALGRVRQMPGATPDHAADIAFHLAEMYLGMKERPDLAQAVVQDAIERAPSRLDLWGVEMRAVPRAERLSAFKASFARRSAIWTAARVQPSEVLESLAALALDDTGALLRTAALLAQTSEARNAQGGTETTAKELSWIADILVAQLPQVSRTNEVRGPLLAALGRTYAAAARWDAAERMLAEAVAAMPGVADKAMLLARRSEALIALQRPAEALDAAREAARLTPAIYDVRWNLARRLRDAGRAAEAGFEYRALLEQYPGHAQTATLQAELAAMEQALNTAPGGSL